MEELRQKNELQKHKVRFVFLGRNKKIQDFLTLQGVILLDPFWFQNDLGQVLIKKAVQGKSVIQLSQIFKKHFDKYYSYKIHNILRLGYYADIMCKDTMDQKMNFVTIRSFFDHAILYFAYLKKFKVAEFPCELEYAMKDGHLTMMVHVATDNLTPEYLIEAFGEDNIKNPMSSLLKTCWKSSDYFDVMYYPKAKRLTLMGVWVEDNKRQEITTSSLSLRIVNQSNDSEMSGEDSAYDFDHQMDPKVFQEIDEKNDIPKLTGGFQAVEELFQASSLNNDHDLLKQLTFFIKENIIVQNIEKAQSGEEIANNEIAINDVKQILEDFPDCRRIQSLTSKDFEFLSQLVACGNLSNVYIDLFSQKLDHEITIKTVIEALSKQIEDKVAVFAQTKNATLDAYIVNWNIDLEITKGDLKKDTEIDKVHLVSFVSQYFIEKLSTLADFRKILANPKILFDENITKEDCEIKISDKIKTDMADIWKQKMGIAILEVDVKNFSEQKMKDLMMNQLEVAMNSVLIGNDLQLAKTAGMAFNIPESGYFKLCKKIEEELIDQYSAKFLIPEDKIKTFFQILDTEIKNMLLKINGQKQGIDLSFEIIERMNIPKKHQELLFDAFKLETTIEVNDSILVKGTPAAKDNDINVVKGGSELKENDISVVSGNAQFEGNEYKVRKSGNSKKDSGSDVVKVSGNAEFESNEYKVRLGNGAFGKNDDGFVVTSNETLLNKIKELEENQKKSKNSDYLLSRMETKIENIKKEYEKEIKKISIEKDIARKLLDEMKKRALSERENAETDAYSFSPKNMEVEAQKKRVEIMLAAREGEVSALKMEINRLKNKSVEVAPASIPMPIIPQVNIEEYQNKIITLKEDLSKERKQTEEAKTAYFFETNKVKMLEMKVSSLNDMLAKSTKVEPPEPEEKASTTLVGTWTDIPKDAAALTKINKKLEETNKSMVKEVDGARAKLAENKITMDSLSKKINEFQFQLIEKEKILTRTQNELKTVKENAAKKFAS